MRRLSLLLVLALAVAAPLSAAKKPRTPPVPLLYIGFTAPLPARRNGKPLDLEVTLRPIVTSFGAGVARLAPDLLRRTVPPDVQARREAEEAAVAGNTAGTPQAAIPSLSAAVTADPQN